MAKCKYPNEMCFSMTVLNGVAYCDSVPCHIHDEMPAPTTDSKIIGDEMTDVSKVIKSLQERFRELEKIFDKAWDINKSNKTPQDSLSRLCTTLIPNSLQDIGVALDLIEDMDDEIKWIKSNKNCCPMCEKRLEI